MPLALPDFEQLRELLRNVMNRLYPAIQEQQKGSEILLALSSIFCLEKKYDELPAINKLLRESLEAKRFTEEENIFNSLTKSVEKSYFMTSIILLIVTSLGAFFAVSLFRVPTVGWAIDWKYISDNAALIVFGILAAWTALIVVFKPKGKNS